MGRDLTKWAAQQNFLPKGDYQVLLAMGMVAHDSHGQFFGNPAWFLEEYQAVHGDQQSQQPQESLRFARQARLALDASARGMGETRRGREAPLYTSSSHTDSYQR